MNVFILLGIVGYIFVRIWKEVGFSFNEPIETPLNSNEYYVYTGDDLNFFPAELHTILNKHISFYTTLTTTQQTQFIYKVQQFFDGKNLLYVVLRLIKKCPY